MYAHHRWYIFHTVALVDDEIHSHSLYNSITIISILAVVILGFQLCHFNIGRCNDVQVRGCVTCHCSFFCSSLVCSY